MPIVIADQVIDADVQDTFADAYDQMDAKQDPRVVAIMEMPQSRHRQETYGTMKPAPHVELWIDAIPEEAMGSESTTVVNRRFGKRVKYRREDQEDTEATIGGILDAVAGVARNTALLAQRILRDILDGTTATIPAASLALDGVALHSATDGGGGARFDRTGGNVVDGAGVANEEQIVQSRWLAVTAMREFLRKGQPMWSEELLEQQELIRFPAPLERLFRQSLGLDRSVHIVQNGDPDNVGGFSALGNAVMKQLGSTPVLWPDPLMSGDSWMWFKLGVGRKPTIFQVRTVPEATWRDHTNSDEAAKFDYGFLDVRVRAGGGALIGYNTVLVDESE